MKNGSGLPPRAGSYEKRKIVRFTPRGKDELFESLEKVARGFDMSLVELTASPHRGRVQLRLTVYKKGNMGIDDCSRLHRAVLPRLELAFPGR
jgi:ribosome maturation factor RimP